MKYKPVIVVVAYNRPGSLERLLFSLGNVKKIADVKLIISIDNNAPENYNIRDIAERFNWPFGEKEVIYQERKLGLRKHILQCGDFALKYGSVIILEDDLFVSPYFYDYAIQALEYYYNDENIGGVSLYNHTYEDITDLPFSPLADDSDVYFIQFPSSLGQAWTADQWTRFRNWLQLHQDISDIPVHIQILTWPETSWKKYFSAYLFDTNKFFVFPRISLTTNFNDPGTHKYKEINFNGQAQIRMLDSKYRFKELKDSFCLYDSHFELLPSTVKHFREDLSDLEIEMDLYGLKDLSKIEAPLVITSKPVKKYLKGYQRALKPHDLNIINNLNGNDFFLCNKEDALPSSKNYKKELHDFRYFYTSFLLGKKAFIYEQLTKYKIFKSFIN